MTVDLMEGFPEGGNAVDCADGYGGIVVFSDGTRFYSMGVGPDEDGDIVVRVESGTYLGYSRDGRQAILTTIDDKLRWIDRGPGQKKPADIVEFVRCPLSDPRARGLRTEAM